MAIKAKRTIAGALALLQPLIGPWLIFTQVLLWRLEDVALALLQKIQKRGWKGIQRTTPLSFIFFRNR